ncbi:unnamed protein product [Debaryomyces tyrocola]|nr:unnamed protein product [Debaryomyces tyrocola]
MEEFLKDSPSDFGSNTTGAGTGNTSANYGSDPNNRNNYGMGYYGNNYGQPNGYPGVTENDLNSTNNNYTNEMGTYTSSLPNDPFLEDLESLNFSNKQPQYINPTQSTSGHLEEIISPSAQVQNISLNNNGLNPDNSFVNPQYFSPSNRNANYNTLNSIAEDSLSSSFNNAFSPSASRNDSVSIPFQNPNTIEDYNGGVDINAGSYLSPQFNSQYMSPSNNFDNSIDTLKSPSFNSGSYLNSPPKYQNTRRDNSGAISNSIPSNISKNKIVSPPPLDNNLGTSLPGTMHNQPPVSTKQLSKEEKLKRRREFHNAVERRRRDLIKERIKDLGFLVPPSLLNPQLCAVQNLQRNSQLNSREINDLLASIKVKETKPNKSTILNKSVDYIIHLKYVLEQQDKSQRELAQQIEEIEARLNNGKPQGNVDMSNMTHQSQPSSDIKLESQDELFNPDDFFLDVAGNSSNQANQFFSDSIR